MIGDAEDGDDDSLGFMRISKVFAMENTFLMLIKNYFTECRFHVGWKDVDHLSCADHYQ